MANFTAKLPDGRTQQIALPDGISEQQAQDLVGQMYLAGEFGVKTTGDATQPGAFSQTQFRSEMIEEQGGLRNFAAGVGGGLSALGRGLSPSGDTRSPQERENYDQLRDESPAAMAGDIFGIAAPLVATAPLGGAGLATSAGRVLLPAAESLLARLGLQGLVGAGEGAAITRGEGGDADAVATGAGVGASIAAAGELIAPYVGRLGHQIFARLGKTPRGALIDAAGRPTAELSEVLDAVGMSFDELTADAVDFIATMKPGMAKEHIERAARFKQEGIPFTRGDMTQTYKDQSAEQRLMGMALDPDAAKLRDFKSGQSRAFEARVNHIANQFGNPEEAGETIKTALASRDRILFERKQALYSEAFEKAPQLAGVELIPDTLVGALPSSAELRRLKNVMSPEAARSLDDLMVEFGLETGEEAVDAFLAKRGNELLPLTLETAEEFRQGLLRIQRADTSGAASVVIRPLVDALDNELDTLAEAMGNSGVDAAPEVLDLLKQARATVRQRKTEFSPDSLAGRLIGTKTDGQTPLVEASRVYRELESKPVEQLKLTLSSLYRQGDKGREAIGNMKAAVVLRALDDALKAPSRKDAGMQLASGEQFAKYLERKFGKDRLDILFAQDPEGLAGLNRLAQVAKDMSPQSAAVPKGSATVNMDMLNSIVNAPGLAIILRRGRDLLMTGENARATSRALNITEPDIRQLSAFEESFPAVAAAIGITQVLDSEGLRGSPEEDQ